MRALLPLLFSGLLLGSLAGAADPAMPDFKKDVLPVFEEKCIHCHGAKRKGGKLDMRTMEAMLEGGDTGPAFKPGNAKKSLLIELIHYKEMPPKKKGVHVTPQELEMLRHWINSMSGSP